MKQSAQQLAVQIAKQWNIALDRLGIYNKNVPRFDEKKSKRPTELFRYCYKLASSMDQDLTPQQIQNYILGNLKIIQAHGGQIRPSCLVGKKAEARNYVFQKKCDETLHKKMGERQRLFSSICDYKKFYRELVRTSQFLSQQYQVDPNIAIFTQKEKEGYFRLWCGTFVTKYYYLLSPWIRKVYPTSDDLWSEYKIDTKLVSVEKDKHVQLIFNKVFSHEQLITSEV